MVAIIKYQALFYILTALFFNARLNLIDLKVFFTTKKIIISIVIFNFHRYAFFKLSFELKFSYYFFIEWRMRKVLYNK